MKINNIFVKKFFNPTYRISHYRDEGVEYTADDLYPSDYEGMACVWIDHISEVYPDEVASLSKLGICLDKDCFSRQELRCMIGELSYSEECDAADFIDEVTDLAMAVAPHDPFFDAKRDATHNVISSYYWWSRMQVQAGVNPDKFHLDNSTLFLIHMRADLSEGNLELF